MLLILRHGPNQWVNELDVVHHIKVRVKVVLGIQGRQVGDGGWRAGAVRCGLKAWSSFQAGPGVGRGQGDVLQVGGEGPSAAMASAIGLIATPRRTHFLLMTSILLLLLLVQAESESCEALIVDYHHLNWASILYLEIQSVTWSVWWYCLACAESFEVNSTLEQRRHRNQSPPVNSRGFGTTGTRHCWSSWSAKSGCCCRWWCRARLPWWWEWGP